jgi:hypothetical protein
MKGHLIRKWNPDRKTDRAVMLHNNNPIIPKGFC